MNWLRENYKWLFDGFGAVAFFALLPRIAYALKHSIALVQGFLHRGPNRLGQEVVAFDYLPGGPLTNGWRLVSADKPGVEATRLQDRPGCFRLELQDALDYDVSESRRQWNRVEFSVKLSPDSYVYAKVSLEPNEGKNSKTFGWIAVDIGDSPPRRAFKNEWVIYRRATTGGWAKVDLYLPDEVARTFGKDQGIRFAGLLGFRIRGSLSISPIRYSYDERALRFTKGPATSLEKPPLNLTEKVAILTFIVALLGIVATWTVPEGRRLLGLEKPTDAEHRQTDSSSPSAKPSSAPLSADKSDNTLRITQSARDISELRRQNHVEPILDAESAKTFLEIPVNSYGFAEGPALSVYPIVKVEIERYGHLYDFEIQKLSDGSGLIVGFVGPDMFETLRTGLSKGSELVLYSDVWQDAPKLVALPAERLVCSRNRPIGVNGISHKDKRKVISALDCAVR
ncbi:MAG TPA: hypothetical protein VGD60_09405 [Candidatus Acidoferrales bacterium]